ncbi:P-loop containing nucleoside triphosphate hydrolase protein [Chytriomyces sp. MP71]|nr:P-loop containing nucleoside triphosphate hydrolase protein [Chytriomyces sp. MP71]
MESRAMEKVTGVQTYAGYERQKGELAKILDSSLFHHDIHARLGIKPSKTVLLTGLSGVGKSALIHSTLHELDLSAHTVDILDLALFLNGTEKQGISISEQLVCPLSKAILRARACPPAVVILEGLDHIGAELIGTGIDMSLCAVRISSILSRMNEDSDSNHVCILATCRDDQKLPAVLSRFGLFGLFHTRICLEAPSREERKMMYQCLLEGVLQSSDDTDLLAQVTAL